ncbi:DeoR family transcriptional regulator [Streptomyces hygroscopicus]|uniref:dienelactone hydrolase family protein n=1 Tax=Streptomyces hygroscopicus TaxID=1912 RepID=UPI00223F889B|nr:dienelactone hydrolase family protein [Streptomyces hygroscopicus]MCW7942921.1 DeoR family transcriptional regulator [Streptomyces hygroscopicus]
MISELVVIPAEGAVLEGDLVVPGPAPAVVLFAHGSGSSRFSPRNRAVAAALHKAGLGTLLLDLLTEREEREDAAAGQYRFDIGLLSRRLVAAMGWLAQEPNTRGLPVGLFGASTGAAAALVAAAEEPERVYAVVSRGGRPDLAGDALERVSAPVLLIVGGNDEMVLDLNRKAAEKLSGPNEIVVVPGATHLFAEPGALEQVAQAADQWFLAHLKDAGARTGHPG